MKNSGTPILYVPRGKRAVLTGRTGSGKTQLARWLLLRSPGPWVILNPKHSAGFDEMPNSLKISDMSVEAVNDAFNRVEDDKPPIRFVIINPPAEWNNPESLDYFINLLFNNFEGLGLYVDELVAVHKNGRPGDGLTKWLTMGREPEMSFIGSTQRPRRVSLFVFSETDYFGIMNLNLPEDKKRIYEFVGDKKVLFNPKNKYEWRWYVVEDDDLTLWAPVPV